MYSRSSFFIAMVLLIGFPVNHSSPFPSGGLEWPNECNGKTYCHAKPFGYPDKDIAKLLKTLSLDFSPFSGVGNRSSDDRGVDVAGCGFSVRFEPIYLIKDQYDRVRIVPQRDDGEHLILVRIEECRNPGRVFRAQYLKADELSERRVDCLESRLTLDFPVLSLDRRRIDIVPVKDGLPISCSAKIMENP